MNLKYCFALIILGLIVFSCKKDKPKGEEEILIGTWNWYRSDHRYGWCDGESYEETLIPELEGEIFSMNIAKKGKVMFYQNDLLIKESRIVFDNFYSQAGSFIFDIHLNNKESDRLLGRVYGDSLFTWDFPYRELDDGCGEYKNMFERIN